MIPSDRQKRDFFKTLRRKNAAVNIQRFLAAGVSLEERDSAGRTPLIIAARYGDLELVNTLLAAGADVEARDNEGSTPLLHALTYNVVRPEVVQRLLQAGAQLYVPYGECYADALSIVASHGDTNILPLLLEAGASVSRRPDGGFSLLLQAVGHPETFQALLAAGANLHGGDPARLLLAGITMGDADTAAWLRGQGISLTPEVVQRADADSYPVLVHAIYRTKDDDRLEHTLRLLLKLGADVNAGGSDRLYTPLTMAIAEKCRLSIIRLLLEAGAEVNSELPRGFTALYSAVYYQPNHAELLRLLLEAGADPNPPSDPPFHTPLYLALTHGDGQAAQLLLAAGADLARAADIDPLRRDFRRLLNAGQCIAPATLLLHEILRSHTHTMTPLNLHLLLEAGAEVNQADDDGATPLMLACRSASDPAIIRLLLEAGADIFARDAQGDTPYDYARRSGHAEQHLALLREFEHQLYPTDTP